MHIKGYSAPETKAAAERARLLIEQAERLGEPPEDPLLLFSVLYGFWYANLVAFNGDVACDLAAQFLALAEKQRATIPLMVGHRLVASSSQYTGDIVDGRAHYDQALALYDPAKHRSLATRFGQDIRVMVLSLRSTRLVDAWLSRSRTGRRGSGAQGRPRDRSRRVVDVCAGYNFVYPNSPRKLCSGKRAS